MKLPELSLIKINSLIQEFDRALPPLTNIEDREGYLLMQIAQLIRERGWEIEEVIKVLNDQLGPEDSLLNLISFRLPSLRFYMGEIDESLMIDEYKLLDLYEIYPNEAESVAQLMESGITFNDALSQVVPEQASTILVSLGY